jgi:hypothetical protein
MRNQCQGTKRNGQPCNATAVLPSGFCTAHDPSYREQRAAQSAKGGRHKSNKERAARNLPDDMRSLGAKLLDAFDRVYRGDMDGKTAAALSSLATAYIRVWEAGRVSATFRTSTPC